ncbi:MAG: sodium-translocating pyrophosphatase [Candidatus Methanomethylicia archaeon]
MFSIWLVIVLGAGLSAVIYALALAIYVLKQDKGSGRMIEIYSYIKEGAKTYLAKQYMIIIIVVTIIAFLMYLALRTINSEYAIRNVTSYVIGALSSSLCGFVGMYVAVNANVRTANSAKNSGLNKALKVAFSGGTVLGMSVVGVGLLSILLFLWLYSGFSTNLEVIKNAIRDIVSFAFGASTVALFARVGGGIYTKAADIGADLVGKVEKGIPEDDPRNPGVIADNVGDNVGDVAGMGADLYESYVEAIISTMVIGVIITLTVKSINWIILPMAIAGIGIVSSIISTITIGLIKDPSYAITSTTFISTTLTAIFSYFICIQMLGSEGIGIFMAVLAGLVVGMIVGITSDYFTNRDRKPVKMVAEASQAGPALTILTGFSIGFLSTVIPMVSIAIASIISYTFATNYVTSVANKLAIGLYGVAISAVGMLAPAGVVVAADAYGPVTDNAAGIAEQAGLEEDVRAICDRLDSIGNTMKSICKGFAIGSAALTALALISAYIQSLPEQVTSRMLSELNLMNPYTLAGIIIGASLPAILTSIVIMGVSRTAYRLVEEIRRQFREIPGLMEGKAKPDYGKCVGIATVSALKNLIVPGIIALSLPIIIGLFLGPVALGGMLIGAVVVGLLLGLFQGNVGNTWDNAKKYVELGNLGGKGSDTHKAAVIGDTVGDPMKDSAGPAQNIFIKLMSVASLTFATIIALFYF